MSSKQTQFKTEDVNFIVQKGILHSQRPKRKSSIKDAASQRASFKAVLISKGQVIAPSFRAARGLPVLTAEAYEALPSKKRLVLTRKGKPLCRRLRLARGLKPLKPLKPKNIRLIAVSRDEILSHTVRSEKGLPALTEEIYESLPVPVSVSKST